MIFENNKRLTDLVTEHKKLVDSLGNSYIKEKSARVLQETKSKKEKHNNMIKKQTNSQINVLLLKIKSLQSELKSLKEKEDEMSFSLLNTTQKVEKFQEKIRYSPVFQQSRESSTRSYSVKPKLSPSFFTELSHY